MKLTGTITLRNFGKGSKSEHTAVYLDTAEGSYVLRKKGANPFENNDLKQMEGKQVVVEGTLESTVFFASDIDEK